MIPKRNAQLKKGLNDMCLYLKSKKIKTILEIGSWAGSGAEIFAQHFQSVTCVDPWDNTPGTISSRYDMKMVEKEFDLVKSRHGNIIKIKSRIENFNFENRFYDCIYIDAEHTYEACKRHIELSSGKCIVLAGHDYWPKKFPGVVKAVNELLGKPDKIFSDSSWIKVIK